MNRRQIIQGSMGIIAQQWVTGEGVQLNVHCARGAARISGLITRRLESETSALLLPRCRSVHGVGLKKPLDVVFTDRDGLVLECRRLRPWRALCCRRAAHAFELRAGAAERLGIAPGMRLRQLRASTTGGER